MKFTVIAAVMLMSTATAVAQSQHELNANNHGFETAALEVCKGMLKVSNPKQRAKLDRMYRQNPRWREHFLKGYEAVMGDKDSPIEPSCALAASDSKWLMLNPATIDALEIKLKKIEEERKTLATTPKPSDAATACKTDWAKCADNDDLRKNYDLGEARFPCQIATADRAIVLDRIASSIEWPRFSFTSQSPIGDHRTGVITLVETRVEFRNGPLRALVECEYDLRTKKVLRVKITK